MNDYDINYKIKFYDLASKLDNVIRSFENNIYIISNSNIHLPRHHPDYLHVWKFLIHKKSLSIFDNLYISVKFFSSLIENIFLVTRELFRNTLNNRAHSTKKLNKDYLFVSHHLGTNQGESDFYYGNLLIKLSKQGKKVVRALIPQTGWHDSTPKTKQYESILLNNPTKKKFLLNYIFSNLISVIKLIFFGIKNKYSFYEIVGILIGQLNNFTSIKILHNLEEIISANNFNYIIVTFEGNAIERSIFLLSHKYQIICIGYQHAPVIKGQYSIFRSLSKSLDPEIIMCSGPYTYSKFKEILNNTTSLFILGRKKSIDVISVLQNIKPRKNILLIPDGNSGSVDRFFKLGLDLSNIISDGEVSIRSHPLQKDFLLKKFEHSSKDKYQKFYLSSNDLLTDLTLNYWIIYENSSVCIEALLYGCEVIYLANQLASVDPLWELDNLHFSALTHEDINEIITNYSGRLDGEKIKIKNFANNYFSNMNKDLFLKNF